MPCPNAWAEPSFAAVLCDTATVLILVRHGRTPANAAGLLQGRLDQDLDEFGQAQAVAVAQYVRENYAVDAVIASPLLRAQQTAAAFGLPIETDERWIELSYGEYEGTLHTDVPSTVWQRWRDDPTFTPEGGESLAMLDERVRAACVDLVERAITRACRGGEPRVADEVGGGLGARHRCRDLVQLPPRSSGGVPDPVPRRPSRAPELQRDGATPELVNNSTCKR